MTPELAKQIEQAYDYRGHVTLRLKSGEAVEGFLFNRQIGTRRPEGDFVELMLKGSGEKRLFRVAELESILLSGEDCAAGNSYEDYLKKKREREAKG